MAPCWPGAHNGTHHRRASARCIPSFLLLLLLLGSSRVSSQVIAGRLLDDATGAPVADARVALEDLEGIEVDHTLTASDGSFRLHAEEPRRYVIRATHLAYAMTTSPAIELEQGVTLEVELRVAARAVLLAPLTVVGRREIEMRDPRLKRWGYYDRKESYGKEGNGLGFAYFLEGDDIRPTAFKLTDVLRDLSGIYVGAAGGRNVSVSGRRGCALAFYLDGVPMGESLEVPPIAIVAIEVYTNNVRPAQFLGSAMRPSCGAVVVWTGNRRLR